MHKIADMVTPFEIKPLIFNGKQIDIRSELERKIGVYRNIMDVGDETELKKEIKEICRNLKKATVADKSAFYIALETMLEMLVWRYHGSSPYSSDLYERFGNYFLKDGVHINKIREKLPSDLLAEIIFADCASQFVRSLPERYIKSSDVYFKLTLEAEEDELLLKDLTTYVNKCKDYRDFHQVAAHIGEHIKLKGVKTNYFGKLVYTKCEPYVDYELEIALQLLQKGIYVKNPIGLAVIRRAPYVILEYAENAVDMEGYDAFKENRKLKRLLSQQAEAVYTSLGKYVRKMFDNGVSNEDIGRRNFMAQFDMHGIFTRVFMVDLEKVKIKHYLTCGERMELLESFLKVLSKTEKEYFIDGYTR